MLNRLSIDAIVAITNELEGRDIARLWLCGDALLNHRLGSGGGVKKFSQTFNSLFPGTWPSIVIHFVGLEEFTVNHYHSHVPEGEWKPRYSDLSKTVVRVRMAHPDDFASFHEALLAGGTPNLLELTNVSSKSSLTLGESGLQSLMALLPHLQVLRFDWAHPLPLPPSIWPKQLQKLHAYVPSLDEDPSILPESLEALELRIANPSSLLPIQWPPNLLKLEAYCYDVTTEELKGLPRSLTELILPNSHFYNSPENWNALPPNLTVLSLGMFRDEDLFLRSLPRTLKLVGNLPAVNLKNVKILPPGLISLNVDINHDPKIYELLPTRLRTVTFAGGAQTREGEEETESSWTRLPDTLEQVQQLDVRYLDHYPLPSCLTSLSLSEADLTGKRVDRLVSSKLAELSLSVCKFENRVLIECLPRGLTLLSLFQCVNFEMDGELCKLLPKTLRVLKVFPMKLIGPKALAYLPAGLTSLFIQSRSLEVGFLGDGAGLHPKLECISIRVSDLTPGLAPYLFATMPRRMQHFTLAYPREFPLDITDASLESLPPGLVSIETTSAPALVSGSWLASKPRCLHSVRMGTV